MRTPLKRITQDEAETIALAALSYITGHEEVLGRFLAMSGLEPGTIRHAAASPGFLAAILDYVASDEPLLIALSKELDVKPERIMEAHRTLSPLEFE